MGITANRAIAVVIACLVSLPRHRPSGVVVAACRWEPDNPVDSEGSDMA
jgi:hypothetical protein